MIIYEPNREFNLDITDESCGVIGALTPFALSLPFLAYCAGQIGGRKDLYTKTRKIDGIILLLTTKGQGQLSYLGKCYTLSEGDAVLIDGDYFHEYKTLGKFWETYYIRFGGSAAQTYVSHIHRDGFRVIATPDIEKAKKRVSNVIDLCTVKSESAALAVSLEITALLTELAKAPQQESEEDLSPSVSLAKEYIEKHFKQELLLDEIARVSLLSTYHLSRLFKAQTGVSPHAYIVFLRVKTAKRLLLTTQMSIQEISEGVGFSNVNIFIRAFKNAVGMTPTAFRSKNFY